MGHSPGHETSVDETTVDEVQGVFPSDAMLQDAIGRLTLLGFDRGDLSLPAASAGDDAPNQGASDPNTDVDSRQLRTMGAGIAASAGAMAAAGAVVATGGLALPVIGAAVAGGLASGAASHVAHRAADRAQDEGRDDAAAEGRLVLAVRLRQASEQRSAEQAMEQAGATRIVAVARRAPGSADSAGWTG